MAVRPLCAPGDLDLRRPLPGRPAAAQRVTAVAATAGLSRVAVATAAPWFPGLAELLVLTPGEDAPPLRLPMARRPQGAVVRDMVFSSDDAALTVSLGGSEEQQLGQVAHFALRPRPVERWRRSLSRPVYAGFSECGGLRLAVSGDGRVVAGCDQSSRSVLAWSAADGSRLVDGAAEPPRVGGSEAIAVDGEGSRLAFRLCRPYERAPDGGIAVLTPDSGALSVLPTGLDWCAGLAFAPNGALLVVLGTAGGAAQAVFLDPARQPADAVVERRRLAALPAEAAQQTARPVWGAAGPRAALRADRTVTVWDLAAGEPLCSVSDLGRSTAWALTPDGRALVVASPAEVRGHDLG
ncbi:hypothetical protein FH609_000600 [Streptomyces sp. 3MP-14]|uniref:WD40 repeat domain-containing protein n=1 Tax=Streptomyces mimosae TaxID=2586635 RepID=A0A5N6AQX7_9ACTN|nr:MULTISPECIES: hypothetical protein [Streptomyces]KAB8171091.1 hypothetical protein FH607_001870 [Streptomyces mimosae]KAB8179557.1 hypothetical protein FH609_000600 [Streptomyces sp. 3MP-14]